MLQRAVIAMVVGITTCFVGLGWCLAQPLPRKPEAELETDRDTFTFAPSTAGANRTISEFSYSFIDNRQGPEAHSVPEMLIGRGIRDRVELRMGFNYEAGGPGLVSGSVVGGEDLIAENSSRVIYGAKVETSDQPALV